MQSVSQLLFYGLQCSSWLGKFKIIFDDGPVSQAVWLGITTLTASLDVLSKTWRKHPMRPGLGRSLSAPQEVGWWGDPLGTKVSKWGHAIATGPHEESEGSQQARWDDVSFFFVLPGRPRRSALFRRVYPVRADTMLGQNFKSIEHRHRVHLTVAYLTQSRQLDHPADDIGR